MTESKRTLSQSQELRMFANALRDVLDLEPLCQDHDMPRTWQTELRRFYATYAEAVPYAKPKLGSGQ